MHLIMTLKPGENEFREVIVKNLVSGGEREKEVGGWEMGVTTFVKTSPLP